MPLFNTEGQPRGKLVRRPLRLDRTAEVDRVQGEHFFDKIFPAFFKEKNSAPPPETHPSRNGQVREMLSVIAKSIEELQALEARCKALEARYEEMRREFCARQQELYNQPLVFDTDADVPTIAGVEANWTEDSSLKTTFHSFRLAAWAHTIHGMPVLDILAALAARLQFEDILYVPESDWPAVLEWFADLIVR